LIVAEILEFREYRCIADTDCCADYYFDLAGRTTCRVCGTGGLIDIRRAGHFSDIKSIVHFFNGNVMVFDHDGNQMSEFQGFYDKVGDRLREFAPANAEFESAVNLSEAPIIKNRLDW